MPVTISENVISRPFTLGQGASRELIYDVIGSDDEAEVQAAIVAEAPAIYANLVLESIQCEPQGNGVWKVHVRYAGIDADKEFTFDTAGGTTRITQALADIATYIPPYGLPAPDFQGAIGVSGDRVEGVDIISPGFEFTETHRKFSADVDLAYRLVLFNMTGRVNDAAFRGFAAGEVLLLGVSGSRRGDELWSITYRFSASPNVEGMTIGEITGIDKLGWEYLWIRYEDYEDDDAFVIVKRPSSVHVNKVYHFGDFSTLEIGTDPLDE